MLNHPPLVLFFAVLTAGYSACFKPDVSPAAAAIAACNHKMLTCRTQAQTLCDLGEEGAEALASELPYPSLAATHQKSLVLEHARCTANASPDKPLSPEIFQRLLAAVSNANKSDMALNRIDNFPVTVQLQLATVFKERAWRLNFVPEYPKEPAQATEWCKLVPPMLPFWALTDSSTMKAMFSHDCGVATSRAMSWFVSAAEGVFVAHEDELETLHPKLSRRTLNRAMSAFRRSTAPAGLYDQRVMVISLYLSILEFLGATKPPWRWLEPIFYATRACDAIYPIHYKELFSVPRAWSREGKKAFAAALLKDQKRCNFELDNSWRDLLHNLGDDGIPLAVELYWPDGECASLPSQLVKARKFYDITKSTPGTWTGRPLPLKIYEALEAAGRKRCPKVFEEKKPATPPQP